MPNILVAVANADDPSWLQHELREFGYRVKTAEGRESVLRHAYAVAQTGLDTIVIDSRLVTAAAADGHNLVEELKKINEAVPIMLVSTIYLGDVSDEITKQALTRSDVAVYSASPSDVRLALETLLASR